MFYDCLNNLFSFDMFMSREGSRWAIVKAYFREKCQRCGKTAPIKNPRNSGWLLHHIDKNEENNDIKNLTLLCKSCHAIVHKDDLLHPRKSNIIMRCPICGRFGSLSKCGRALRIYHGRHKKSKNYDYCGLSKYTHRKIYGSYFPSLLTDRKAQAYPLTFHEETLKLKQKGRTYDEIAEQFGIGKRTIVTWIRGK